MPPFAGLQLAGPSLSTARAASAAVYAGLGIADPLIGVAITVVILRITWESWSSVRDDHAHG